MGKVILSCKGDNVWREEFDSAEAAIWYLTGMVSQVERFYHGATSYQGDLAFDIEDDCILWEEDGKTFACAGWHWFDEVALPQIMLGDLPLYKRFYDLEMG